MSRFLELVGMKKQTEPLEMTRARRAVAIVATVIVVVLLLILIKVAI